MPLSTRFIILSITGAITACGGLTSSDDPELNGFNIVDTGGSDSAVVSESDLLVDANEELNEDDASNNEGEFRLYWDIVTDDDYTIDLYINDEDRIGSALAIYSGVCDNDDNCHEDQELNCDFQNSLEMECEDFNGDNIESVNIALLTNNFPEDLYFILEVCDPFGFDCEDQSIKVRFDDQSLIVIFTAKPPPESKKSRQS